MSITASDYNDYVHLKLSWNIGDDNELIFRFNAGNTNGQFKFPKHYNHVQYALYVQGIMDIETNCNIALNSQSIQYHVLPLTEVISFDCFVHQVATVKQINIPIQKANYYMIFAVASFTAMTKSNAAPKHVASCIGVIPYIN